MRKALLTFGVFAVVFAAVFGTTALMSEDVALPRRITESSACPAVGCVSGACHSFDEVPSPDGVHEMTCPEMECASVECHAYDTLLQGYRQASDASLTLWIIGPVAIILVLVFAVKKL